MALARQGLRPSVMPQGQRAYRAFEWSARLRHDWQASVRNHTESVFGFDWQWWWRYGGRDHGSQMSRYHGRVTA